MSKRKTTFRLLGLLCIAPTVITFFNGAEIPSQRAGLAVLGLLLLFTSILFKRRNNDDEQNNLINYQRNKIRIKHKASSLPITASWLYQFGVMRRKLRKGGRRELGNLFCFGAPGRGKSSLLKWWLTNSDALNFVVVDLKGELWEQSAGHRSTLGKTFRFDLTSTTGDSLDALNTDNRTRAMLALETFLPTNTGGSGDYFNEQAVQIALCYWQVARATKQGALPILIQAATLSTAEMILFAEDLVKLLPVEEQETIIQRFENAFGLLWKKPNSDNGERNSVIQSFKGAFSKLDTPEITSTINTTSINIKELTEERATLYISAPTTSPPYAVPIQLLLGGLILEINEYIDKERKGKQAQDIVILADEAGNLKIPMFTEILSTGRSRGLTITAFMQTMGQLDQYHKRGWHGLVDVSHHWCWFNTNDPDAHRFLRERCGRDNKGKFYFDKLGQKWKETEVIALLDYDRIYAVHGPVINPYGNKQTQARMQLEPPQLQQTQQIPAIRTFALEEAQRQIQAKEAEQSKQPLTIIPLDAQDPAEEIRKAIKLEKEQSKVQDNDSEEFTDFAKLDEVEKF